MRQVERAVYERDFDDLIVRLEEVVHRYVAGEGETRMMTLDEIAGRCSVVLAALSATTARVIAGASPPKDYGGWTQLTVVHMLGVREALRLIVKGDIAPMFAVGEGDKR